MTDYQTPTHGVPVLDYMALAEQLQVEHPAVIDFQAVDIGNVKNDADFQTLKLLVRSLNLYGFPPIILGTYCVEDFENGGSRVYVVLKLYPELTEDPASIALALRQRISQRFKGILDGSVKRDLSAKYPQFATSQSLTIETNTAEEPQKGLLLPDWVEVVTQHPNLTNQAKPFQWLIEFTNGAEATGSPIERIRAVSLAEVSRRGLQTQFFELEAAAQGLGLSMSK